MVSCYLIVSIPDLCYLSYFFNYHIVFNFLTIFGYKIVGPKCNNFEKNRAFYDKSMKLGTWLVDNKTKKLRVSATPKMSSNGRHLVFPKWPPFSTYSF